MNPEMGNKLPALLQSEDLNNLLKEADFDQKYRILEANLGADARSDYEKAHIQNAIYFDTLTGVEPTKYLPKNWPNPEEFGKYLSDLGISNKHKIIIYDRSPFGFFASSRVWMHLRAYGNENVSILSGGLNQWLKKNYQVTSQIKKFTKAEFIIKENKNLSRNYEDILKSLSSKIEQLVDARPREEFNKENVLLGVNHIPTAKNFPYPELFDSTTGTLKDRNQLTEMLKNAEIDLSKPSIFYCNTSLTASTALFVAFILGYEKIPVYRGSWIEYSLRKEDELKSQTENTQAN